MDSWLGLVRSSCCWSAVKGSDGQSTVVRAMCCSAVFVYNMRWIRYAGAAGAVGSRMCRTKVGTRTASPVPRCASSMHGANCFDLERVDIVSLKLSETSIDQDWKKEPKTVHTSASK